MLMVEEGNTVKSFLGSDYIITAMPGCAHKNKYVHMIIIHVSGRYPQAIIMINEQNVLSVSLSVYVSQ